MIDHLDGQNAARVVRSRPARLLERSVRDDLDEFERAWWAFVRRWDAAGGAGAPEADALIDRALAEGLAHTIMPGTARWIAPADKAALACEIAVITRSGEFDEAAYRRRPSRT